MITLTHGLHMRMVTPLAHVLALTTQLFRPECIHILGPNPQSTPLRYHGVNAHLLFGVHVVVSHGHVPGQMRSVEPHRYEERLQLLVRRDVGLTAWSEGGPQSARKTKFSFVFAFVRDTHGRGWPGHAPAYRAYGRR